MAPINLEKIEAIAPDQASLVAARKLVKPSDWSGISSDGAGLIWGERQWAGSSPYRVVVSEVDAGYKCSLAPAIHDKASRLAGRNFQIFQPM